MSELSDLHRSAMELASRAEIARRSGDEATALALFREAFEGERRAALLVAFNQNAEPTRSVLLRSAASLALDCGETREAERLIATALAGNPPDEIAEELRDLYETVTFRRHLEVRGQSLSEGEFQMSLAGSAVGFGIIDADEYLPRIATVESLLVRTAERQQELPFRERGAPDKTVSDNFGFFVSMPRAASFAVTIRVGKPVKQHHLFSDEQDIVFEFLDCLTLFSDNKKRELQTKIPQPSYYRNFVSQATRLAPDGLRIRTVGFTASFNDSNRQVSLRSAPSPNWHQKQKKSQRTIRVVGTLLDAHKNERRLDRNVIGIRNGAEVTIITVPKGLMADVVRPYFDKMVVAYCTLVKTNYRLIDIREFTGHEESQPQGGFSEMTVSKSAEPPPMP
jgi:hypothetical protein